MSSDSEDDCYSNIAQKLQSMKNKYSEDKIETTNLLIADLKEKTDNTWRKNDSLTSEKDCDLNPNSQNSEPAEEYSLDAIIAKNSTKRVTRSRKRAADICVDNILPEKVTRKNRTKKSDASTSQNTQNNTAQSGTISQSAVATAQSGSTNTAVDASVLNSTNNDSVTEEPAPSRGRGRGRGRGRAIQTTPRGGRSQQSTLPEVFNNTRARGRSRQRRSQGRRSYWASQELEPALYDFMAAIAASAAMANPNAAIPGAATGYSGPIYSVGNTDEYPDQCGDQPLFNSVPKPKSDVIVIEENETELNDNEELSVKVYWQSSEHVKFNIRRFQKLKEIFDHFAERENVSHDKLFFTYNDRILKSEDTPDSINYSIVKFIDGGIINQSVSSIVKKVTDNGIKLKFQCQNVKKPFIMSIRPDEKMSVVMMKCAEHLEKPLDKLKFHFDGDLILGKHTARELELEGGECIDVGIVS